MKVLALDISTKTGWALFEGSGLVSFGLIEKDKSINEYPYDYPKNFLVVVEEVVSKIIALIATIQPDKIVIEETNKPGRFGSRFSQKILEWLHHQLLTKIDIPVKYINTSEWRKHLKLSVAESKKKAKPYLKEYALLEKAFKTETDKKKKKDLKNALQIKKLDLKSRCMLGKIDKKSISVAYVNAFFNLNLKKVNNDVTDAICIGQAFITGAKTVTNEEIFNT